MATQLVRANGFDPSTEDGQKRVEAILIAADVCETYAQFTRAARYALEPAFTKRSFTQRLMGSFRTAQAAMTLAAAAGAMGILVDLADDGLLNLSWAFLGRA